jgi:DNA-binding NarL/FixJ family response regulator
MNGLDAAREIGRKAPNIPMLMLTMDYSEQLLRAAEAVGIKDVCSKIDGLPDPLIAAIQEILDLKNFLYLKPGLSTQQLKLGFQAPDLGELDNNTHSPMPPQIPCIGLPTASIGSPLRPQSL